MAKSEGWQLDRASYPFSAVTQTRFQDLDLQGHLNNVAIAALFETGRFRFHRSLDLAGKRDPGARWLVARIEINYISEGRFPDDADVASGIARIGNRSWQIASAIFQGDACVATAVATIVYVGPDGAKEIPAALRKALEEVRITTG